MRGIKSFFSSLFREWAERLDKSQSRRSILKKTVEVPRWVVEATVAGSVFLALVSEFGFERNFLVASVVFVVFWMWLARVFLELNPIGSDSKFLLVAVMTILTIIFTQAASSRGISKYYLFVPLAASLIHFLVSRPVSSATVVLLSLLVSMILRGDFEMFLYSLAGGIGAVSFPKRVLKRGDLFLNGFSIFIFLFAAAGIAHLFGIEKGSFFLAGIQAPLVIGVSTSILAMAFLPVLEYVFNITSDIRLVELGDFNMPLLKKLMIDAPGTYHHSLIVASLADAAANAIGGNSLLARVGAYYHDIGKIRKPQYFIENQTEENVHENLKPEMSALVIVSHTKDGLALAEEYGLDDCIKDFIAQHHGTTIVQYFYKKATDSGQESNEDVYRYPGPTPRTRETAIVMLADSVEAACRSIEEPNYEKIKDTVNRIINN
ncbi:MAG: HDIG domain-containing protein, partial [Elusimicrobia bacterium]|nr:HDIG domain-containing protein [Elusimicrobiota bacterium]